MYSLTGAYDEGFFKSNYDDTWPMAKFISPLLKEYFSLGRVLDLGCASGHYIKAFSDCGVVAIGIEGSEKAMAIAVCDPEFIHFLDLREKQYIVKENTMDMVMSVEVAEHIEEEFVDIYVHNLTSPKAKYIYMTAAPPGQGGHFHVNCQPQEYWINKIEEQGYKHHPEHKEEINKWLDVRCECYFVHEHDDSKCEKQFIPNWFPGNLMVFEKEKYE